MNTDELLSDLLALEGVGKVYIRTEIKVSVQKEHTGRETDRFQPIRKRISSENEVQEVAREHGWNYSGTIDTMSDYWVKDRLTNSETVTEE